jgi:hypothetical protein
MKQQAKKLTKEERLTLRKEKRKQKEKTFSKFAFLGVALAGVLALGILLWGVFRTDAFRAGFTTEELLGSWYSKDELTCWRFDDANDDNDVYFYYRNSDHEIFAFSAFTDFVPDEKEGTVTVYYGNKDPQKFTASIYGDKLILKAKNEKMVFYKGKPISERNKEIYEEFYPQENTPQSKGS